MYRNDIQSSYAHNYLIAAVNDDHPATSGPMLSTQYGGSSYFTTTAHPRRVSGS